MGPLWLVVMRHLLAGGMKEAGAKPCQAQDGSCVRTEPRAWICSVEWLSPRTPRTEQVSPWSSVATLWLGPCVCRVGTRGGRGALRP